MQKAFVYKILISFLYTLPLYAADNSNFLAASTEDPYILLNRCESHPGSSACADTQWFAIESQRRKGRSISREDRKRTGSTSLPSSLRGSPDALATVLEVNQARKLLTSPFTHLKGSIFNLLEHVKQLHLVNSPVENTIKNNLVYMHEDELETLEIMHDQLCDLLLQHFKDRSLKLLSKLSDKVPYQEHTIEALTDYQEAEKITHDLERYMHKSAQKKIMKRRVTIKSGIQAVGEAYPNGTYDRTTLITKNDEEQNRYTFYVITDASFLFDHDITFDEHGMLQVPILNPYNIRH